MNSQHVQNFVIVDATNKPCPIPLLMLKRALKNYPIQPLKLLTSDPNSKVDILRFCQLRQIKCTFNKMSEKKFEFTIVLPATTT